MNDWACGGLAVTYMQLNRYEDAEKYFKQAEEARLSYYNSVTASNLLEIKRILDARGIKFVCVQYPIRSLGLLREIFKKENGVVFVDNEEIFKNAIRHSNYNDYFIDMFAGDFGHCTPKGNRLLAENIANVILREVFHKQ